MPQNEVLVRPAAELAREKTLAAIKSQKQAEKHQKKEVKTDKQCQDIKDMPTFENEVHNTSPNASNIAGGV